MGKLTQYIDFLTRESDDMSADFIKANYTHIEITDELRAIRRREKWYIKTDEKPELRLF
jgi:hypothetical protein